MEIKFMFEENSDRIYQFIFLQKISFTAEWKKQILLGWRPIKDPLLFAIQKQKPIYKIYFPVETDPGVDWRIWYHLMISWVQVNCAGLWICCAGYFVGLAGSN